MRKENEHKELSRNLGKRIKEFRQLRHMTGDKLSEAVGISPTFLWDLEKGNKNPSLETLVKIANVLECGVDNLLCDSVNVNFSANLTNISLKLEALNKEQIRMIELTLDSMITAFREM